MTREEIFNAVVKAISKIQTESQRDVPPLQGKTRLIGDIPGCDSLTVVEISIVLEEILSPVLRGSELPDSILHGVGKNTCPTLDEITNEVETFIGTIGISSVSRKKHGQSKTEICAIDNLQLNDTNGHYNDSSAMLLSSFEKVIPGISPPLTSAFPDSMQNENTLNGERLHE